MRARRASWRRGRSALALAAVLLPLALPAAAAAHVPEPGAAGIGDPYFPLAGNGGYDVGHYDLVVRIDPVTKHLDGHARIRARATQALSRFDLDLAGLTVRSITVDGRSATFRRDGGELIVTPRRALPRGHRFTVAVAYDGTPTTVDSVLGAGGTFQTDDGLLIVGEPDVAATWFPVNDHPLDKATYAVDITVPKGYEAVSNGHLLRRTTRHGWTTFSWHEPSPMASYLATATVGRFAIRSYTSKSTGLRVYDAIDPTLLAPFATPSTGTRLLLSSEATSSYQRLVRQIAVPAAGATVAFDLTRQTETDWDYFFVEAHAVGSDAWTTLPDQNGHTSASTGNSCPFGGWQRIHPFLAHYQTDNGDGTCTATGSTGTWSAATGMSDGRERWVVDLSPWAGQTVELALATVSDETVQQRGVAIDDVAVSTGAGSTSFESDGDVLDGWQVAGPPPGSPGNTGDYHVGGTADVPAPRGALARDAFAREPEIVRFLAGRFGPYPFRDVGGVVDHLRGVGFALENQTRPLYAEEFFDDPTDAASVVVHELAHQWYGDQVSVGRWQDIWLNEGFATYAEWLWAEHEGGATPQQTFDGFLAIPSDDGFWQLAIGDPGADHLFDFPVYGRGAMTLQALRVAVGDDAFFRILRRWVERKGGGNGTTPEFIKLAEHVSGKHLDAFFTTWLFTASKPKLAAPTARAATTTAAARAAVARLRKATDAAGRLPRR